MRISDWSSDVCSSDLRRRRQGWRRHRMELRSEKGPGALAQPRYSVGLWFEPRVVSQIRCDPKAREHFRWIEIHLPMQGEDRQASGVDRPLALPFGDGHEVERALACSVFQDRKSTRLNSSH